MVTRRSHQKSRSGCKECKRRRIKVRIVILPRCKLANQISVQWIQTSMYELYTTRHSLRLSQDGSHATWSLAIRILAASIKFNPVHYRTQFTTRASTFSTGHKRLASTTSTVRIGRSSSLTPLVPRHQPNLWNHSRCIPLADGVSESCFPTPFLDAWHPKPCSTACRLFEPIQQTLFHAWRGAASQ